MTNYVLKLAAAIRAITWKQLQNLFVIWHTAKEKV